jgi:hypothetical protein
MRGILNEFLEGTQNFYPMFGYFSTSVQQMPDRLLTLIKDDNAVMPVMGVEPSHRVGVAASQSKAQSQKPL